MADVTELTDSNFEAEVLKAAEPVLVDFWAPWCGPCHRIAPLIEKLAQSNAPAVRFAKINIDDMPAVATNYGVSSIPTLMIFKGGEVVDRFVGVTEEDRLQEALDQAKA